MPKLIIMNYNFLLEIMQMYNIVENIKYPVKAAIFFTLIICAVYSPIIFLNQSYNQSTSIPPGYFGYEGKDNPYHVTIDADADFDQIWPIMKLESKLISNAIIPLWNPYLGTGSPIAADTDEYIFSPLAIGFLLPVKLWDVSLLASLWAAGFFTFLFLQRIGLKFSSSIIGGLFYMFSGAFSWYLPHTNVAVIIFTPLILYYLEKIIQTVNPKYIAICSVAFAFGILGAHIESIIFQLILIGSYFVYRIFLIIISNKSKKNTVIVGNIQPAITQNLKKIVGYSVFAFIGGVGLSGFFILPAYEFLVNGSLGHDNLTGITLYQKPIVLSSAFIPYILGPIKTSWGWPVHGISNWTNPWGYVGTFALFFSIAGIYLNSKIKNNSFLKYTPFFFLFMSIFFIMKIVNVPIINFIGFLPVLKFMDFTRYTGAIISLGFGITAAFGIDSLAKSYVKIKTVSIICIITLACLFSALIPIVPYIISPNPQDTIRMSVNDAFVYTISQIAQSILFIIIAFLLSITIPKNKNAILGIVIVILLELSLYIPLGLSPGWMMFKSIVVSLGMIFITLLILLSSKSNWKLFNSRKNLVYYFLFGILLATISGEVMVSYLCPVGMMEKYDSFQPDPLTNYLKQNLGNYRIFSFDYNLRPNYPAAYEINSLGIMSSVTINSFHSFKSNFLDQGNSMPSLGFPPVSMEKYFENKKYFDFLGVKYLVSGDNDLNSFVTGPPRTATFTSLTSGNDVAAESFVSPYNTIYSFRVGMGTYAYSNHGNVTLTVDSIPSNPKYHRESIVNAQNLNDSEFNEFKLDTPLTNSSNKLFHLSLRYLPTEINNKIAIYTYDDRIFNTAFDQIKEKLHGQYYKNNTPTSGKEMAFSFDIHNVPTVFKFHNVLIHQNLDVYPRTFLINKFHIVDDGQAQDFLLRNPDFDLRHEVILEKPIPDYLVNSLNSSVLDENSKSEITSYSANKVLIHTSSDSDSLLVLTDSYYPGWKAFVDGKETTIYRADSLVRTIFVPSGDHNIEFSYLPQSFVMGILISLTTTILLAGIFVISNRKEKHTHVNN